MRTTPCKGCGMSMEQRFMSKVYVTEGCWFWLGRINSGGYGVFDMPGHDGLPRLAHRISYEIFCGLVPLGFCILHSCDTPPCVNPKHLWIGTQGENIHDMDRKGRRVCGAAYGSSAFFAKLHETQIPSIRNRLKAGQSASSIAKSLGLHHSTILDIRSGKTWKHIL